MLFYNYSNVTNAGNNQLILSNTVASGTNRSILNLSEVNDVEVTNYRFRCGIWIAFILATVFVIAAKYISGHEGSSLEISVYSGLLALLLLACLYSMLCRRTHENNSQERHMQEDQIASLTNASLSTIDNLRPIPVIRQHPPPPYHIAILIPPPDSSDEAAPPSYDKVIQ